MANNQAPPGVGIRRGSPVAPTSEGVWTNPQGHGNSKKARSVVRENVWTAPKFEDRTCYLCDWGNQELLNCRLDLTDPTGRMHAAWAIIDSPGWEDVMGEWEGLFAKIQTGMDCTAEEVARLAALMWHIVGTE